MIEHLDTLADPFEASRPDVLLGDASRAPREPNGDVTESDSAASGHVASFPMRVVGTALLAGFGAMLLAAAVRAVTRRRSPRRPSSTVAAVKRSLTAELGTRALLGAAGVVGAHLASDVLLPALTRRLAAQRSAERSAVEKLPPTRSRRATARTRLDDE